MPKPSTEVVFRKRLLDKLSESGTAPLTLICAPAGFGKTTLAIAWASQQQFPTAWVSLDNEDNDPVRWLRHVVAALRTLAPHFGDEIMGTLNVSSSIKLSALLPAFVNQALALETPVVLILDDYHVISDTEIHQALNFILGQLPSQLRIVITSRTDPPLALAKLRAQRQICELSGKELRFNPSETGVFVNEISKLRLSAEEVELLTSRTEGWIAGLQLAVLSLAKEKDKNQFIRAFAGNDRYIMDYLTEEVLSRQSAEVKTFLLQTSILDRMTGPLCDAIVMANNRGAQMLEKLESDKMFVIPLDNQRCWYRYHHLFAELLQHKLEQLYPESVVDLHCKASRWYLENGFPVEAMNHALAAESYEDALAVLNLHSQRLFITGQLPLLLGWYARIPENVIDKDPVQLLVCMWTIYVATGVFPKGLVDGLERIQRENRIKDEALKITVIFHVNNVNTYLSLKKKNTEQALTQIQNCFDILNKIDPEMHIEEKIGPIMNLATQSISLRIAKGFAYYTDGRYEEAEFEFNKCMIDSFANDFPITATSAIAYKALIYMFSGHLHHGAEEVRNGLDLINKKGWAHNFHDTTWCYYTLAAIAHEQNNSSAYHRAVAMIENFPQKDTRGDIKSSLLILQARWHYSVGDITALETTLADMAQQPCEFIIPILPNMEAQQMGWHIRLGRLKLVSNWLDAHNINDSNPIKASQEYENILWVRLKLARKEPQKAIDKIVKIITVTESQKRYGVIIELLILKALAQKQLGLLKEADDALCRALALAQPESYVRIFADEGPSMAALLRRVATKENYSDYAQSLLNLMESGEELPSQAQPMLSKKELETLKLMICGLSNKEISEKLFVSVNTIKTHVKNIYTKLGVNSRAQLVARAKSLEL